jgi:hypothetical protein
MRDVPHFIVSIGVIGLVAGCRGCEKSASERPTRFVQESAEAVFEVRDLGALAKSKSKLTTALSRVMTNQQLEAIEQQATLALGFDPATEKGLEDAGLPREGAIACEISSGGQGALWVIPAKDRAKLEKTIDHLVRLRAAVEGLEKVKSGDVEVTLMTSTFGPEKFTVAAYTFSRGYALIGAGPKAREIVERAVAVSTTKDGDITHNAEWIALDRILGHDSEARLIVPRVAESASGAFETIARLGGPDLRDVLPMLPDIRGMKSAGWSIRFAHRGLTVNGRVRLTDSALARSNAGFKKMGPPPGGVRALDLEDAVVFGYASGDPAAILKEAAPQGSRARGELDAIFARTRTDLGVDPEQEILPLLSGQGALAMGVGSLAGADVRTLLENPARYVWTSFSLGAADPKKLEEVEKRIVPKLEERGFSVSKRESQGEQIRVLKPIAREDVLIESAALQGAFLHTNDAKVTDRLIAAAKSPPAGAAPLDGKPGFHLDLRFFVLAKALDQLNLYTLPVLYRAIAMKAVETMHALDRGSISLGPTEDGIAIEGRLQLASAEAAPSNP